MKRFVFLFFLFAGIAFAGKVVTYTAVSDVSQEDANNMAMAGVAKQISSRVQAKQTLEKKESTTAGKSSFSENFRLQSNIESNVKIKGVSITPVKVNKGFKATATLDMDEFTADIQFQMKAIKQELVKLDSNIRNGIQKRQYATAVNAIDQAKAKIKIYEYLTEKLSAIYPINDSHLLQHDIPSLETKLQEQLSQIRIEGPSENFTIGKPEMPAWSITVYDAVGPVENFPVRAKQGFQTLLERRAQSNGSATFNLRNVNFEKGPYTIVVEPNFSDELLSATSLEKKFELSYQVNQTRCSIRIKCNELANICSALEKKLSDKSIFVDETSKGPMLDLKIVSTEEKALKVSENITRFSYKVDLSLKNKDIQFITSAKEAGKNATDGSIKAIGKMDFSPLQRQLKPFCE
jgi:hypothetical protein